MREDLSQHGVHGACKGADIAREVGQHVPLSRINNGDSLAPTQ